MDPFEADIVRMILELKKDGGASVADALDERALPRRNGEPWTPNARSRRSSRGAGSALRRARHTA